MPTRGDAARVRPERCVRPVRVCERVIDGQGRGYGPLRPPYGGALPVAPGAVCVRPVVAVLRTFVVSAVRVAAPATVAVASGVLCLVVIVAVLPLVSRGGWVWITGGAGGQAVSPPLVRSAGSRGGTSTRPGITRVSARFRRWPTAGPWGP